MALDHRSAGAGGMGGKALLLAAGAGGTAFAADALIGDDEVEYDEGPDPDRPSRIGALARPGGMFGPLIGLSASGGGGSGDGGDVYDQSLAELEGAGPPTGQDRMEEDAVPRNISGAGPLNTGMFSLSRRGSPFAPISSVDLLSRLYDEDIDDATFRGIQEDLYMSGYYGEADPSEIVWGSRDDTETFSAWRSFVSEVEQYANETGGDETGWYSILQAGVDRGMLQGRSLEPGTDAEELEPGLVFQTSDPAAVGSTGDSVAEQLIGRRLTPEEKRVLVGTVHSLQRESQEKAFMARRAGGPDVEVTTPNPTAQAEQQLMEDAPDEVAAHAVADQVGALMGMLQGGPAYG